MFRAQVRRAGRRGFTLVEVLVSIAIALVLIAGISQIFSIAQQATGAGNAVLSITEAQRSAQPILLSDLRNIDNTPGDSPGIVIVSYPTTAFRDAKDQQEDRDGDVTTLNDPAGTASLPAFFGGSVNQRVKRTDKLVFLVRGNYARQTGGAPNATTPPDIVSSTTASEACVWIGHVCLPNNQSVGSWDPKTLGTAAGMFFAPGATANGVVNDNNQFASSWVLGREVTLLSPSPTEAAFPGPPTSNADPLSLRNPSATNDPSTGATVTLPLSRFDLAATTIDAYRRFIIATPSNNGFNWWEHLSGTSVRGSSVTDVRFVANPFVRKPPAAVVTGGNATVPAQWMSAAAAQSAPIFVRGCTHFIVEFAGDYVTQNPDGSFVGAGSDGQIDFIVDQKTGNRNIRWYGFPRDTNNDGTIDPKADVVPLNDYAGGPFLFERSLPQSGNPNQIPLTANISTLVPGTKSGGMIKGALPYVCAWGPDTDAAGIKRPKLIRITLGIDDPGGHLNSEQFFEYVFELP